MIYAAVVIFAGLLYVNSESSQSLLYPPALFSAVWLVSLAALTVAADRFHPISADTVLVYCAGGAAFSVGGGFVYAHLAESAKPVAGPESGSRIWVHRALDVGLLMVVIGLPFLAAKYWGGVEVGDPSAFAKLRAQMVQAEAQSARSFQPLDNLVNLAIVLALALHYENDGSWSRRWRAYLGIALAFIAGALSGTKGNALVLLMALTFISFLKSGRVNARVAAMAGVLGIGVFGLGLAMVNFAYDHLPVSLESVGVIGRMFLVYWLGGIVAFDRIVQDPHSAASSQHISRFFLETVNGFGARFEIPSIHAAYTQVSGTEVTNVYTLYFSYFKDPGWLGMILLMAILGAVSVWLWNEARRRSVFGVLFYGIWAGGLVLSIQAEHFLLGLNFYIKMLVVLLLVYKVIPRLAVVKTGRSPGNAQGRGIHARVEHPERTLPGETVSGGAAR